MSNTQNPPKDADKAKEKQVAKAKEASQKQAHAEKSAQPKQPAQAAPPPNKDGKEKWSIGDKGVELVEQNFAPVGRDYSLEAAQRFIATQDQKEGKGQEIGKNQQPQMRQPQAQQEAAQKRQTEGQERSR